MNVYLPSEFVFVSVTANSRQSPEFEAYREADGSRVLANDEFTGRVSLGMGEHTATRWTTDLSYEYVRINAEYRT